MKKSIILTVLLCLECFGLSASAHESPQETGRTIELSPIDDPVFLKFGISFFSNREPRYSEHFSADEKSLPNLVEQDGMYGETKTDPKLVFFMLDNVAWCGTAGCRTYIFRHVANGLEWICETSTIKPKLMPARENGLPVIRTNEKTFLHWHASQPYNSGKLCWQSSLLKGQ